MKHPPLSYAQGRTLRAIRDHGDPTRGVHGLSAHGGLANTIASLERRGFIERHQVPGGHAWQHEWVLTAAGREAIEED